MNLPGDREVTLVQDRAQNTESTGDNQDSSQVLILEQLKDF